MKNLIVIAVLLITGVTAKAQFTPHPNAIKINPLSLVLATGNISYERAIGEDKSIQVGAFYSSFGLSDLKYRGFGITPEFRFYFAGKKQALNGVYVAPFARYQNFRLSEKDNNDNKATFSTIGGGATIGWQKMWGSGFVLDLFAGPSYSSMSLKAEGESEEDDFNVKGGFTGFGVRTGITIGFGF
jgi:hypothetical protein